MNFICEEDTHKRQPIRQCALYRSRSREDELLRFVLDPDGRVVPDIKRKLPGRGVWITASHDAVAQAVRQKTFNRGFKCAVSVDPDLADRLADLLRRAALQNLALANKAGCVVAGYAKVEKALRSAKEQVLLHASDASADGCRKLDRLASALRGSKASEAVACFSSDEVSGALGKSNVNHAAIMNGGAGQTFIRSAKRYISYMGTDPAAGPMADTSEQEKA